MASINSKNRERPEEKRTVQIVLVGYDSSQEAHEKYLLDKGINFPALKFGEREKLEELTSTGEAGAGALPFVSIRKADGTIVMEGSEMKLVLEVSKLVSPPEK